MTSALPFALLVLGAAQATAPLLNEAHEAFDGALTFKTPAGWVMGKVAGEPNVVEASSGPLRVRFVYTPTENGFDSLHVTCMLERLAGAMDSDPQVSYEYDFLSGEINGYKILDSAFVVAYDAPVQGERVWRQRNLTIVGSGKSLCAISYAPLGVYKKSKTVRDTLEQVLKSVALR
jgi:hypothetical protein